MDVEPDLSRNLIPIKIKEAFIFFQVFCFFFYSWKFLSEERRRD
jgi:hypothetical protein